jgi:uncharacterized membrane protein YczE
LLLWGSDYCFTQAICLASGCFIIVFCVGVKLGTSLGRTSVTRETLLIDKRLQLEATAAQLAPGNTTYLKVCASFRVF